MPLENVNYECDVSGHIFPPWKLKDGISPKTPSGTYSRACVIPGCHTVDERDGRDKR